MTLIVDRMEDRNEREESTETGPTATSERRRIDVTDLHADGISEFVDANVDTDAVSLEHRGARTYLVLES
ncbi:hypothetical protein CV102_24660 [Natronococcus pandeyae]|uniref:Uncharacterized protein n=1 Tax=Natronococcus pandeyae TaxID=2055836 RepID=A0A8J8Q045_9EURY|nr:hypothetical protein [Natronococcus pandeyae]TYL36043.1 hypothetical protein CV102_24660 [Natronococcus pandeyae]